MSEDLKVGNAVKVSHPSLIKSFTAKITFILRDKGKDVLAYSLGNRGVWDAKYVTKIGEGIMSKKRKNLDEGMIMISSLMPAVGGRPTLSIRGNKKDNFEFKGLPGQFNEAGTKVIDDNGNRIVETANTNDVKKAIVDIVTKNIGKSKAPKIANEIVRYLGAFKLLIK